MSGYFTLMLLIYQWNTFFQLPFFYPHLSFIDFDQILFKTVVIVIDANCNFT